MTPIKSQKNPLLSLANRHPIPSVLRQVTSNENNAFSWSLRQVSQILAMNGSRKSWRKAARRKGTGMLSGAQVKALLKGPGEVVNVVHDGADALKQFNYSFRPVIRALHRFRA
jgi:hypothetical protein